MTRRIVAAGVAILTFGAVAVGVSGARADTTYTPTKGLMFEQNAGESGGYFHVSNKPINGAGVHEKVTSTGIKLSVPHVDTGGYRDAGVFMKAGKVKDFHYGGSTWDSTSNSSALFTNVWFDVDNDGSFFGTSDPRKYTGQLGDDTFGELTATGDGVTFNNGVSCSFEDMSSNTDDTKCDGVMGYTGLAVEVGLMNTQGSASMTVTRVNNTPTVQGEQVKPPYVVSKIYPHSVCRGKKGQWWTVSNVQGDRTVQVTIHTNVGGKNYYYKTVRIAAGQSYSLATSHGGYMWGYYYDHGTKLDKAHGGKLVKYRTRGPSSGDHTNKC